MVKMFRIVTLFFCIILLIYVVDINSLQKQINKTKTAIDIQEISLKNQSEKIDKIKAQLYNLAKIQQSLILKEDLQYEAYSVQKNNIDSFLLKSPK